MNTTKKTEYVCDSCGGDLDWYTASEGKRSLWFHVGGTMRHPIVPIKRTEFEKKK